jgi:hypothetical protein
MKRKHELKNLELIMQFSKLTNKTKIEIIQLNNGTLNLF